MKAHQIVSLVKISWCEVKIRFLAKYVYWKILKMKEKVGKFTVFERVYKQFQFFHLNDTCNSMLVTALKIANPLFWYVCVKHSDLKYLKICIYYFLLPILKIGGYIQLFLSHLSYCGQSNGFKIQINKQALI